MDTNAEVRWEGLPYEEADGPITRVTRIDLDRDEDPAYLHLLMTGTVADYLRAVHPIETASIPNRPDLVGVVLPMGVAADLATALGKVRGIDEIGHTFSGCIVGSVAQRFWEYGLDEAPTAGMDIDALVDVFSSKGTA